MKGWIVFVCVSVSVPLLSQDKFVVFDDEIGYCSHSYHIIQDDFGFLWSATLTGLVKTDGYEYKKFTNEADDPKTIASNFSAYLFEDRYSNIWVNSHQYGLSIYDRSEDQFVRIEAGGPEGLKSGLITDMISINDTVVYICGNAGLEKTIVNNKKYEDLTFELFSFDDKHKVANQGTSQVWDAELIGEKRLFISSIMGFALFDTEEERYIYKDEESILPDGVGFVSCFDKERYNLWVAQAGHALLKIDLKTGVKKRYEGIQMKGGEHYMLIDSQDRLWIKENGFGIILVDLDSETIRSYDASKNSEIANKDRWAKRLIETRDGSVFIASNSDSRFQHIPSIDREIESTILLDRKDNNTSCIYEDDEFLSVSFFGNGIYFKNKLKGKEEHFTSQNSKIADDMILSVKRLSSGDFLILGKPHAYIFDPDGGELNIISTSFFYRNGLELSNGDLWLFSEAYAVDRLRKTKDGRYEKLDSQIDLSKYINYREAVENEDGTIWIVSAAIGLILTNENGDILEEYTINKKEPGAIISKTSECLFKDSKDRVWVGSLEGLSVLHPETGVFSTYTIRDGLDDTSISDIAEDNSGQIWVSSFDGLYKYDESTDMLSRVSQSHLLNSNFSQRGFFKFENVIYASGEKGIDIIKTIDHEVNQIPPIVQVSNIYKNDEKINQRRNLEIESEFTFSPENRNVSIGFSALHFGTPYSKKYEYRDVNNSNEWIDFSANRKVSMSGFSYGKNEIEVRASNADGIWSVPKKYAITLERPWYNTLWFYISAFFGVCGFFYSLYRWRLNQMDKIKEQQIEIDKQIAEIELKALKAQMNPHFVFNSLNSVKALILESKTDEAIIYLTSFSKLIRKILNNSNDKFVRLQDEIDTMKLYLELESLRFDDAFSYKINIEENISTDFIEVPALLLQPYIENAIWHGLLHKMEGLKLLTIDIAEDEDMIIIEIVDNGIGREEAQKIKTRSKSKNQSFGMSINHQRISLLKDLYGNNASVEIIDLKDKKAAASGTKVIVKFNAKE